MRLLSLLSEKTFNLTKLLIFTPAFTILYNFFLFR